MSTQAMLFDLDFLETTTAQAVKPASYKGLSAFHKYWGKKPIEPLQLLIERITKKEDIVLDPFLGGGLLARIAVGKRRRFVGIDINPCSIELARMFIDLPDAEEYKEVLREIETSIAPLIRKTYLKSNSEYASHYLWNDSELEMVWTKNGKGRVEHLPEPYDLKQIDIYKSYTPKNIRSLELFQNSRINARKDMTIDNFFTGRALHNIDLLLESILDLPVALRRAFLLTLTSASGQMSNMVFAISKRGKNNGTRSTGRVEVGSWAIGFWCPKRHFEINVWDCFYRRANKLLKELRQIGSREPVETTGNVEDFYTHNLQTAVCLGNASEVLSNVQSDSIKLIITDPPHSDRIPYLELSDFWNAILQYPSSDFPGEIVISNAKDRNKDLNEYLESMRNIMRQFQRILMRDGFLCIQFNAKDGASWDFLQSPQGLEYCGCFPLKYSAGSLVQDNRKGAMKHDYVLIYRPDSNSRPLQLLNDLPGWSTGFPGGQ